MKYLIILEIILVILCLTMPSYAVMIWNGTSSEKLLTSTVSGNTTISLTEITVTNNSWGRINYENATIDTSSYDNYMLPSMPTNQSSVHYLVKVAYSDITIKECPVCHHKETIDHSFIILSEEISSFDEAIKRYLEIKDGKVKLPIVKKVE